MQKLKLRRLFMLLLAPAGILLSGLARAYPELAEKLYAGKIYPAISQTVGRLSAPVPFSVAELLVIGAAAFVIFFIVRVAALAVRRKLSRVYILQSLINLGVAAATIYFCFVITSGINYHRYTFAYHSGLTVRPSSSRELAELCEELISEANRLAELQEPGCGGNHYITARRAGETMRKLGAVYPALGGTYSDPKPVLLSELMSRSQITGIFFPFTFEANVNTVIPDFLIPAVMAHEQAHQRGFMREDEANFIAYLSCRQSDYAEFQYSGVMLALVHAMNSLYRNDYDRFEQLYVRYSDKVLSDMRLNSDYWKQYEGTVAAKVSDSVNDAYLKANSQFDGVLSYGRVVDLLLADYRARHQET